MSGRGNYVPPPYIPLGQSDQEPETVVERLETIVNVRVQPPGDGPLQWSSGICACCDDMQSCCVGLFCPCYLFAKNAEFLGSGTVVGPGVTHCMLWALINGVFCLLTEGVLCGLPGCLIACYACNYRKKLRMRYNLQEAPCGDFTTHFFCHLCAVCQEYREIRERSEDPNHADLKLTALTAPAVQKMELAPGDANE